VGVDRQEGYRQQKGDDYSVKDIASMPSRTTRLHGQGGGLRINKICLFIIILANLSVDDLFNMK
jgi:hypothetical protein